MDKFAVFFNTVMHDVVKWPNILLKFSSAHTVKYF